MNYKKTSNEELANMSINQVIPSGQLAHPKKEAY